MLLSVCYGLPCQGLLHLLLWLMGYYTIPARAGVKLAAGQMLPADQPPGAGLCSGQHPVQYRHLHQHAVACFGDHNAAWPVEYAVSDRDSAANR